MKNLGFIGMLVFLSQTLVSQNVMTPELLWQLGRVSVMGINTDQNEIIYRVSTPSVSENKSSSKTFAIAVAGG